MAEPQDDGWETVTDPTEIQEVLGKAGANKVLGLTAGGPGSGGGKAASEGERKTAVLATRLAGGISTLNTIKQSDQRPSLFSAFVRGTLGDTAANYVTGDDRQRVEAAQADILDAALTLGTGAAYTKEQLEGYRKAYFPQLGDSDSNVADKRKRLGLLLESARIGAGSATPQIEAALKASGFAVPEQQAKGGDQASGMPGAAADGSGTPPTPPEGEVKFNDEIPEQAKALTDEQKAALQAVAQSGGSADQIVALGRSFGVNITSDNANALAKFYSDPKNRGVLPAVNEDRTIRPVDPGDGTVGAFARGITSNVPFSREIAAGINSIADGDLSYNEALKQEQSYRAYDEQNHGTAYTVGSLAGAIPLGGAEVLGARAAAATAGRAAMRAGATRAEAQIAANRAFAARTAAEAAGYSGVYALGNADGSATERLGAGAVGAAVGGVVGGSLALAGGRFARAMAARGGAGPRPPSGGQEVLAAAKRQNIVPFPADVGGGATRRATSATAQTIAGAQPIIAGAQRTVASAEAVRDRVAASIGTPVGAELTGETARAGAQAFIARTGRRIGRIYDAAAQAGGNARVTPTEAVRVLDQELAPLRESPIQGPGVAILEGLRDALNQPQTVRGLREARTQLRDQFESSGLRGSNVERIAGRVVDAATDDLVNGLRAQGLDQAARQYRVADRMWAERAATIDDHLEPILGSANNPKSGEQIVQGLKLAMAGNNRRFAGFINALPAGEQSTVRASLIQRLGRATKGQQDDGGEVFSLGTFLTNWNEIGERAKNTLFGAEGRAALNDLARYAAGSREAQRFANFSNTGGVAGNLATAASGVAGIKTLGAALAVQYGAGRLLASPRFARWLARAPQNPSSAPAYVARLSRIARAEPAIANDVIAIQQRLAEAFGGSPARLAADERRDRAAVADRQNSQDQSANQGLQP